MSFKEKKRNSKDARASLKVKRLTLGELTRTTSFTLTWLLTLNNT